MASLLAVRLMLDDNQFLLLLLGFLFSIFPFTVAFFSIKGMPTSEIVSFDEYSVFFPIFQSSSIREVSHLLGFKNTKSVYDDPCENKRELLSH